MSELFVRVCVCVEPQNVSFWAHRKQCVQLTAQSFSAVSKGVEQESQPEMSSGSWQDMAQLVCQQRLLGSTKVRGEKCELEACRTRTHISHHHGGEPQGILERRTN